MYGQSVDNLNLDDRITISSMATEMGAIIILFPPSKTIIDYCAGRSKKNLKLYLPTKMPIMKKLSILM